MGPLASQLLQDTVAVADEQTKPVAMNHKRQLSPLTNARNLISPFRSLVREYSITHKFIMYYLLLLAEILLLNFS